MIRLLTVFVLLSAFLAKADCTGSGMWVYPQNGTISQNSFFIVELYLHSRQTLDTLEKKKDAYLESNTGHQVTLEVYKVVKGGFTNSQAFLKITSPLKKWVALRDENQKFKRF